MLRYIFLKLSGFTSKKEFSISSSCNQMLMFRPSTSLKREFRREPRRADQSRQQHKRSYSFPSRSAKSCGLLEKEWDISDARARQDLTQKKSFHHKSRNDDTKGGGVSVNSEISQSFSTNTKRRPQEEKTTINKQFHEMGCFQESERYELEDARPRRSQSELVFNVFDYVAKDVDLTDYLQPNNLKPFGSNDNIYLPLLVSHKNLNLNSQSSPDYLQSMSEIPTALDVANEDSSNTDKRTQIKAAENYQTYKEIKPYKEIIKKHRELGPMSAPPKVEEKPLKKMLRTLRSSRSKSLDRTFNDEVRENKKEIESYVSRKSSYSKPSVTIEPPPFISKREDVFPSISFADMSIGGKRNIADYTCLQTPWPAYSDHVKSMTKKSMITYPSETENEDCDVATDHQKIALTPKQSTTATVEKTKRAALKKHQSLTNSVPQRRTLSMEHIKSTAVAPMHAVETPKTTKSSVYVSTNVSKNPVTNSIVSFNMRKINLSSRQSYTKSSQVIKSMESNPCKTPDKNKKRCFLASRVRLRPPKCMTKPPYRDCVKPPPCVPRADDCIEPCVKKLPSLKETDCECFEPKVPDQNPQLKRLKMKFEDEPRVCPCVPVECPCPPPIRADEFLSEKEKRLLPIVPKDCECVEPPPMINVPLVRLQKVCEPPDVCHPEKPRICPEPEPCVRADDCLTEHLKSLPILGVTDCRCVEPPIPDINPKIKRLKMEFKDEPRICPCVEPCACPEVSPIRADDCVELKFKKLSPLKSAYCECIEPPRMVDVPLKRLHKVCIPEEVCKPPKKECPVETCEDKYRSDWCLEEKPKKLKKIKDSNCECFERHVPNENPRIKRLRMNFCDEPRVCPCVPVECPCPPPIRADDLATPKEKKLIPHIPLECECVELPRMVNVPLIRLQKVCEPEEKCYPQKPCPIPETCDDKPRADDCLEERPKKLRTLKPKPCPCVEHGMKDAPKIKRLSLSVPEPPRVCPLPKTCPPPEKCARADDCVPQKVKKLPTIKLAECPCIEHPMIDVTPLPRLKCREEPEVCLPEDPCIEFQRADWGCWEYYQPETKEEKCDKKKKCIEYKQKRRFNTDSTVSFKSKVDLDSTKSRMSKFDSNDKKNLATESLNKELKEKTSNASRCFASSTRTNIACQSETNRNKLLRSGRASTLPRVTNANKFSTEKPIVMAKTQRDINTSVDTTKEMSRRDSLPTLFLLKDLEEVEKKDKINVTRVESRSSRPNTQYHLKSLTSPLKQQSNNLLSANVRKLSTGVSKTNKVGNTHRQGEAQASNDIEKKKCDKKDSGKCKEGKKKCDKITKCFGPMILRDCAQKEQRTCLKERQLVCCEKKKVPNPAFSECMDKEVEPYSNSSQWTCDRQQFGFDPTPKKFSEPLDTVKEKKKFSTSATHQTQSVDRASYLPIQNGENPIVDYFSAKYSKPDRQGQTRKISVSTCAECDPRCRCIRNSSSLTEITGYNVDNKDFIQSQDKYPKLLNQKSKFTAPGINGRKMSTQGKENGNPQFNSSGLLRNRPSPGSGVPKKNFSTLKNTNVIGEGNPATPSRRSMTDDCSKSVNSRANCKLPKKKTCAKFKLANCPEKARNTCKLVPPVVICNQRPQAPYPSFSELMDDEMEEKLTECPIEREKIHHLQPRYPIPFDKQPMPEPIQHQQGRIDPKLEEKCIRERLCIQNKGLTQDCTDFGQYIKPMRSKNFFKDRNKDCEKIEELKKLGKWPPKDNTRRHYATDYSGSQRRNLCTSAHSFKYHTVSANDAEGLKGARKIECEKDPVSSPKTKEACNRSFRVLDKPLKEGDKELHHNQLADIDEPCKYTKLRNVQWRINDFQRWRRLENTPCYPSKMYHTCSQVRHRDLIGYKRHSKYLNTPIKKTPAENLSASIQKDAICSKLNGNRFEKSNQSSKHLSISTAKISVDNLDTFIQRRISTTMPTAKNNKHKCIRLPLYPRPIRRIPKYKILNYPPPPRTESPPASVQEPRQVPNLKAIKLQPKYPSVPEIDTVSIPPYQPRVESNLDKECLIHFLSSEKKGKCYDCSAVERPFIRLNSSSLEIVNSRMTECPKKNEERAAAVPCTPCGEVFMPRVHMKAKGRRSRDEVRPEKGVRCPKFSPPKKCGARAERVCADMPEKYGARAERVCQDMENVVPLRTVKVCPPPIALSLWQRIINYFKARPNCPAPDEWKKKALRQRAEKAAKAAGLCLCDPNDLPRNVSRRPKEEGGPKRTSKTSSNPDCFPARRDPCKIYRRNYSNKVDWENCDDPGKMIKGDEEKKVSQVFMDDLAPESCLDDQKCPDPLFENVLNEAILSRSSLTCLERSSGIEAKDGCLSYSLKLAPNHDNALHGDMHSESLNEVDDFRECKHISDFQQYFGKLDTLSEITYEELEKAKTKTLVKALDKLLVDDRKPIKKN